jgi:hypothetical protein
VNDLSVTALAPDVKRQHVVILGAGASLAALPDGDRHSRQLPLMAQLVDVLGLDSILRRHGVGYRGGNFEALYSELAQDPLRGPAIEELNRAIFAYFSVLELPPEPTLYDHLVVSLRPKDIIATFNWDPLLWQALCRNRRYAPMPLGIYLHGSVAVGYCCNHVPFSVGTRGHSCQRCGAKYRASPLLFPVTKKDYATDPAISKGWAQLKEALRSAFALTIFGYSAPSTDVEAVALLREGWGDRERRWLEETEIIDLKPEDTLFPTWRAFINSHHYQTFVSFYDSILAGAPRRSCEAHWAQNMDCVFLEPNPIPRTAGWEALRAWLRPLVEQEVRQRGAATE